MTDRAKVYAMTRAVHRSRKYPGSTLRIDVRSRTWSDNSLIAEFDAKTS